MREVMRGQLWAQKTIGVGTMHAAEDVHRNRVEAYCGETIVNAEVAVTSPEIPHNACAECAEAACER